MDKIIIKNARFQCNLGVSEEERKKKQEVVIDIEIFLDITKAAKIDSLEQTVNYSDIYKQISDLLKNKKFKLIETVAERTANIILMNPGTKKVTLIIKKPNAMSTAEYAAVEITMEND